MSEGETAIPESTWRIAFLPPRPFPDPSQEAAFLADYCQSYAAHRRISGLVALLIWVGFLGWDYIMGRMDGAIWPQTPALTAVRLLGTVVLLVAVQLTRRPAFTTDERYAVRVLVAGCWGMFLVAYVLMWMVPFPYNYLYYFFELLMIMVFAAGPLHLGSRQAMAFMSSCTVIYLVSVLWRLYLGTMPREVPESIYPWASFVFLLTLAIVGSIMCVQTELAARTSFLRQATVQATNEAILRRNAVVEELVSALQVSKAESERHLSALVDLKERLRLEADQRSRDKSTFLATAVHDLRQPIQAIGNALDPLDFALKQGRPAEAIELVDLAKKAVQAMRHQMSSILDVSRLESGLIKAKVVSVDLTELARELADTFGPMASAKGAVLSLDNQATHTLCVRSDPHLLRRVLSNLLSNAIKYRDKKKRGAHCVDLILSAPDGQACIEVVDNGIGIAPNSLASGDIFKPFYQGQEAQRDGERGVGLGLAIVKAMTSLLPDHQLRVSSEQLKGSNFSLTMPLAAEATCPPVGGLEPAHNEIDLDNLYVVLVEDDDLVRNATTAMLQARGVLVEATDSMEGLRVLVNEMERLPDVLLCDYRLSADQTALDAVQLVQDHLGPLAVVIFSGETIDFTRIEPLRHAQILRKPVAADHVLAALSWARTRKLDHGAL